MNLPKLGLRERLLRSDIGQVIKTIVDDEKFPDYAMPKKSSGQKNKTRRKRTKKR